MRIRRLILLTTSIFLGLIAATALLSPVPPAPDEGPVPSAQGPSGPPDPGQSPRAQDRRPRDETPLVVSAQERNQVVTAQPGSQVIVEVRTDEPVAVQVGEDGVIEVAEPQSPAEFAVFVEEGLSVPITLVEDAREIGRLEADEAAGG